MLMRSEAFSPLTDQLEVKMIAVALTLAEYEALFSQRTDWVYPSFLQDAAFARLKQGQGNPFWCYRLEADGQVVGCALVIGYRYKRFLWRAECQHGPFLTAPFQNPEGFSAALAALKQTVFRQSPRIRVFRCAPPLPLRSGFSLSELAEPATRADRRNAWLAPFQRVGFCLQPAEWYEWPLQAPRIFSKIPLASTCSDSPLGDESPADPAQTLCPALRRRYKRGLRDGVEVRLLEEAEFPLFLDLLQAAGARRARKGIVQLSASLALLEAYQRAFGHRCWIAVAEVHLASYLQARESEVADLTQQRAALVADCAEHGETPKRLKRLAQLDQQLQSAQTGLVAARPLTAATDERGYLPLNGGLFVQSGSELVYVYGGTYEDRLFFNGGPCLHVNLIARAQALGLCTYNLYAISGCPETPECNPIDYGVQRFKENLGGQLTEWLGTLEATKPFSFWSKAPEHAQ